MMGVVFDEVVTQIETPPQRSSAEQERNAEAQPPQNEARRWQQQQALFWRRQQRLDAD